MSNTDLEHYVFQEATSEARIFFSHATMRPPTSSGSKLTTTTDTYSQLKKKSIKDRKIEVKFHRPMPDPFVNTSIRERLIMTRKFKGEEGVHTTDEFSKKEQEDRANTVFLTHLSNNRTFENYSNFISLTYANIAATFGRLADMFVEGLAMQSREYKTSKTVKRFKIISRLAKAYK